MIKSKTKNKIHINISEEHELITFEIDKKNIELLEKFKELSHKINENENINEDKKKKIIKALKTYSQKQEINLETVKNMLKELNTKNKNTNTKQVEKKKSNILNK